MSQPSTNRSLNHSLPVTLLPFTPSASQILYAISTQPSTTSPSTRLQRQRRSSRQQEPPELRVVKRSVLDLITWWRRVEYLLLWHVKDVNQYWKGDERSPARVSKDVIPVRPKYHRSFFRNWYRHRFNAFCRGDHIQLPRSLGVRFESSSSVSTPLLFVQRTAHR